MFRNYLKVAWRNLVKHKTYAILNIAGLAIGLASFLLIALYVLDEISYDRHNQYADRIYRVTSFLRMGGVDMDMPNTPDMLAPTLKKDYPQIEQFTRIHAANGPKLIKKGNQFIREARVAHADSTLFNVFTLPSIAGDPLVALNNPNTVVITESTARKYFNSTDVLGKTIETNEDGSTLYKITAVIKDIPRNSHFNLDFIFSMDNARYERGSYLSHNFHSYFLLKPGTDPKTIEKNLDAYVRTYVMPQAQSVLNIKSVDEFEKAGNKLQYSLTPLTDIHLYSSRPYELSPGGNAQYVYIFSAAALFILLIACINFMNLTTARSANRAKEVGIRKVLGTEKKNLILQFLTESSLLALIALVLAILIAALVLPIFNDVAAKQLNLESFLTPGFIACLAALPVIVGLLAGFYPSFYLSAFRPIQVLKGRVNLGSKGGGFRNVLVVFQFFCSIFLIIGTIVMYTQLNYIQNANLGFQKDQVLIINNTYALDNAKVFKDEMLKQSGVTSATLTGFLPIPSARNSEAFSKSPVIDSKNAFNMQAWQIDEDYFKTLGIEVIKGRNFSREFGSDSSGIIINETAARLLGHAEPLGKKVYTVSDYQAGGLKEHTIIGVVKNFHFESLRENIGAVSFTLKPNDGMLTLKVNASNITSLISQAENKWVSMSKGMPFSYQFLDDSFDNMYRSERRVATIAIVFASLAISIACLGLFGLATFIAEQRRKEIGIRKVLGASVDGIVRMLSKNFVLLVFISFILAAPLAWFMMDKWLQEFAYRVSLRWWIFGLAGAVALVIALGTVSFQAIRAALMNPVKSLRNE